jgi:hypothetical protein
MKAFLSIAALVGWLVGGMLLFVPGKFYAPIGISMNPMVATLAQAHAATLIGLAFINWLARNSDPRILSPVLAGNLIMQVLSLGVVLWTAMLGAGAAVVPGIVIHVVLSSLFAYFLLRASRSARGMTATSANEAK